MKVTDDEKYAPGGRQLPAAFY